MKAKLIIDGKEIEVEISDEQAKALTEKPKEKTGYERGEEGENYFTISDNGKVDVDHEARDYYDDELYSTANYYSDRTVVENNARADKLYRQLRRFAVEHRENPVVWKEGIRKNSL